MEKITLQNLHSFCRTCLVELEEKSTLMGEKYSIGEDKRLEELLTFWSFSMPIEELPSFMCRKCYEKLQRFHEFRSQTIKSLCILSDIIRDSKMNATSEGDPLDSGQGSDEKLECSNFKGASEIFGSKNWNNFCNVDTTGCRNATRSQEKIKNCIENAVVKILLEPADYSSDNGKDICSEGGDEIEIDISDTKLESTDNTNAPVENKFQSRDITIQTSPEQDLGNEKENGKSIVDCSDLTAKSATRLKSKKSVCKTNKKSTKSIKQTKKCTEIRSKIFIGGGVKFKCDQCSRRCLTWENYEAHLRTHQDLKPSVYQECGRSFNRADCCRAHVREVHTPVALQYICSYEGCDKIFQRESTYQKHYQTKHKYVNREPRTFICVVCGCRFKNSTKLKEHCYKHTPVEEHPFKCDECGKRYRSKKTFKEHMLRHSGIKKYICPYCGIKKHTQQELREHVNYHTKENQWSCTNCTGVFSTSSNLGRHFRVMHKGMRKYVCSYCNKSFGKKETLRHHEMCHTGEKAHGCEICGKRFIQVTAFRAHMKVHNKCTSARSQGNLPLFEKLVTFVERTTNSEADSTEQSMDPEMR